MLSYEKVHEHLWEERSLNSSLMNSPQQDAFWIIFNELRWLFKHTFWILEESQVSHYIWTCLFRIRPADTCRRAFPSTDSAQAVLKANHGSTSTHEGMILTCLLSLLPILSCLSNIPVEKRKYCLCTSNVSGRLKQLRSLNPRSAFIFRIDRDVTSALIGYIKPLRFPGVCFAKLNWQFLSETTVDSLRWTLKFTFVLLQQSKTNRS